MEIHQATTPKNSTTVNTDMRRWRENQSGQNVRAPWGHALLKRDTTLFGEFAQEYAQRRSEALVAELRQDLAAVESYAEQHGSFADLVRAHYERDDDAV